MPFLIPLFLFLLEFNLYSLEIKNVGSQKSQFAIAKSSFLSNDYFLAERAFKTIIKAGKKDDYAYMSMAYLLNIAERLGDKKLFVDIIKIFNENTDSSKKDGTDAYYKLLYTIGKNYLHDEKYKLAENFFLKLTKESAYYLKSQYLLATAYTVKKKYKKALTVFDKVSLSKDINVEPELLDLATLAKARVFMILKRQNEALVEYQSIKSISPYYLTALKEAVWVFFEKKEFNLALEHLESLVFVNKDLFIDDKKMEFKTTETLSSLDLMELKSLQGYIYMEQNRFNEAMQVFNEIVLQYKKIKNTFIDELKKLNFSDDLTQLISHTTLSGQPRSLLVNFEYTLFDAEELYCVAFREWLSIKERKELTRVFNIYFSLMKEADRLKSNAIKINLTKNEMTFVALRNLMNKYLKLYLRNTIFLIHNRLDDLGLKAQLGRIDIVWKTKETQSENIVDMQTKKQDLMEAVDKKYHGLVK
jgi:tetratricopeptide (TPR) repeat protein